MNQDCELTLLNKKTNKMIPKAIINHSQFTNADYEYLKTKGYNTKEILSIWNRDKKEGTPPVTVNKYKIDWKAERAKIFN